MERRKLKSLYARLKGIERAAAAYKHDPGAEMGEDFNDIVKELGEILLEDTSVYKLQEPNFYGGEPRRYLWIDSLQNKLFQVISYLESTHHIANEIIEIGQLYNSIQDEELRGRSADLLSAPGRFDRVINQATQVLEDRIRTKSKDTSGRTGTDLVNHVCKSDISKTIIKVSDDGSEQEGFCNICRGIMMAFRNPTHHEITDKFSREEALKVCAFIDNLLSIIDNAQVLSP